MGFGARDAIDRGRAASCSRWVAPRCTSSACWCRVLTTTRSRSRPRPSRRARPCWPQPLRSRAVSTWCILMALATIVAAVAIRDFDAMKGDHGAPWMLIAISAAGVYLAVPDTELARVLLGVALPFVLLSIPNALSPIGPAGSAAVAGVFTWVIFVGGRGRPGSVIGGLATLGLLLAEPLGRRWVGALMTRKTLLPHAVRGRPRTNICWPRRSRGWRGYCAHALREPDRRQTGQRHPGPARVGARRRVRGVLRADALSGSAGPRSAPFVVGPGAIVVFRRPRRHGVRRARVRTRRGAARPAATIIRGITAAAQELKLREFVDAPFHLVRR